METINFTKLIGDEVFAVVTMLDPVQLHKLIIRGVEGGGVWVECQALTNFMLEKFKLPYASRVPIFFLSFEELRFVYYAENIPSLNETAFGV
jgi:hypothetical protein